MPLNIRQKLTIAFLLISFICILSVSIPVYLDSKVILRKKVLARLNSIADLKKSQIENYLKERISNVSFTAQSLFVRSNLVDLLQKDHPRKSQDSFNRLQKHLLLMKAEYGYSDIYILDMKGNIIVSTNKDLLGASRQDDPYFTEALENKGVYIKNMYFSRYNGEVCMAFSRAIYHPEKEILMGVLVAKLVGKEALKPIIGRYLALGKCGETFLVTREENKVIFLNELRHKKDTALKFKVPIDSGFALPAIKSSGGEEGIMESIDYRKRLVLAAYRYIPVTNWGFVAKQDLSEAYAEINTLFKQLGLICLLIFIVLIFASYWAARFLTRPIIHLTNVTREIAAGNLGVKVQIKSRDEIGHLGKSFRIMTDNLRQVIGALKTKNKEMEDFIHIISHDMKSPLINIRGFFSRTQKALEEFKKFSESLNWEENPEGSELKGAFKKYEQEFWDCSRFIEKGISRLETLIEGLLTYSRISVDKRSFKSMDLNRMIKEIISTFRYQIDEKNIVIEVGKLPTINCDGPKMAQVFSNLIANAIQYMGDQENPKIEIGCESDPTGHTFFVRDNGIGIEPQQHEKIFQMFHRLKALKTEGEGVGLSFARKIVEGHGGKIWVESQRGEGSTFFVFVPREVSKGQVNDTI